MQQINVAGRLTEEYVNKINSMGIEIMLVFKNTKGQDSRIFGRLNNNVKIRIIGGLDEKIKPKYNKQKYYNRTIYTPIEVARILSEFEKLEAGIQPHWSDLDKALYVYDNLADSIDYGEDNTARDFPRTLNALVTKKAVCAGYALIYKEAMDRLGIECEYISKPNEHAWNAIKIDGEFYPLDLTWGSDARRKGGDGLKSFAGDPDFSENPHHKADHTDMQVPSRCIPKEKIIHSYKKVSEKIKRYKVWRINRDDHSSCYLSMLGKKNPGVFVYAHAEIDSNGTILPINIIFSEFDINNAKKLPLAEQTFIYNDLLSKERIEKKLKECKGYVGHSEFIDGKYKRVIYEGIEMTGQTSYEREDGTSFVVTRYKSNDKEGAKAYCVAEIDIDRHGYAVCNNNIIYSEGELLDAKSPQLKDAIANKLLPKDRLDNKINNVGGYVGYLSEDQKDRYTKYYDPVKQKNIGDYSRI